MEMQMQPRENIQGTTFQESGGMVSPTKRIVCATCAVMALCGVAALFSGSTTPLPQSSQGPQATEMDFVESTTESVYWTCGDRKSCTFTLNLGFDSQSAVSASHGHKKGRTTPNSKWKVEITNVGHDVAMPEDTRVMRFGIKQLLDVFADGVKTPTGHIQEEFVAEVQKHPCYFLQYSDGKLGKLMYSPNESSKSKRLKQQLISVFELDIQEDGTRQLKDGPDGPSMVQHSKHSTLLGETVVKAIHDYSDSAAAKMATSSVMSPSFLRSNAKNINDKVQVFKSKTTEAVVLGTGTLVELIGHSSLRLGHYKQDSAAQTAPDKDAKPDQIGTIPAQAGFQTEMKVMIKLMNTVESMVESLPALGELLTASFDGKGSLLGYSSADIEDEATEAIHAWSKSTTKEEKQKAVRVLTHLMTHDPKAAEIVYKIVLSKQSNSEELRELSIALGHAAAQCHAKGACVAAQSQLMKLEHNSKCTGRCNDEVKKQLHRARLHAQAEDHHPALVEHLGITPAVPTSEKNSTSKGRKLLGTCSDSCKCQSGSSSNGGINVNGAGYCTGHCSAAGPSGWCGASSSYTIAGSVDCSACELGEKDPCPSTCKCRAGSSSNGGINPDEGGYCTAFCSGPGWSGYCGTSDAYSTPDAMQVWTALSVEIGVEMVVNCWIKSVRTATPSHGRILLEMTHHGRLPWMLTLHGTARTHLMWQIWT